jgi:hypothetical protein
MGPQGQGPSPTLRKVLHSAQPDESLRDGVSWTEHQDKDTRVKDVWTTGTTHTRGGQGSAPGHWRNHVRGLASPGSLELWEEHTPPMSLVAHQTSEVTHPCTRHWKRTRGKSAKWKPVFYSALHRTELCSRRTGEKVLASPQDLLWRWESTFTLSFSDSTEIFWPSNQHFQIGSRDNPGAFTQQSLSECYTAVNEHSRATVSKLLTFLKLSVYSSPRPWQRVLLQPPS